VTAVLVTGGAGYIGSHTCKALRRAGLSPVSYDNLSRGNPEAVQWGALEIGELADRERLLDVMARHAVRAVIHFAAFAYVGEANENPAMYYRNNVGGTATLLDAMHARGVDKIVFSSSCAVYGLPRAVPIAEHGPLAPINPYGATKAICEQMLKECAAAFALQFIALRYFNAAGADPDGAIGECHVPETHAIPLLLDVAAGAQPHFTIFGDDYPTADGTCIRDYVHVTDLADAHVAALHALLDGGAENGAFNLGTGRGWSVRELVDTVRAVTKRPLPVQVGPPRAGDPPHLAADASRARDRLGWQPRYSDIAIQIAHAWAWRQGAAQSWKRMQTKPQPA
jgi:UDP-arabinose 4-epimerase